VNGKNLRYAIQAETLNTVLPTELQESRYTALDKDPFGDDISSRPEGDFAFCKRVLGALG